MTYFLLYAFLTVNNKILYAEQNHINYKPIKSYEKCIKEAKNIEDRMNREMHKNKLFQSVKVICKRLK